ncbi:MAG: 1-deoxy-D-xylulose-5-phosphate reductoisomerase [Chloroflexi bacterium]|nr:1-deoxy-D-xylulose-5-phosphate reductoisomerase [Chloroflexota bacterium]
MPRNVVVLGSTGSIGRQTLDIAREMRDRVAIFGLAAHRNVELLEAQAAEFRPSAVVLGREVASRGEFAAARLSGEEGMVELVVRPEVDLVVVGTSGKAGLLPTLAALRAGKLVALANKETLVMAGPVIQELLRAGHGQLVPIDSEHSAIWQCLQGEERASIERLTLTASGGALRDLTARELEEVTPEQALRHPTWSMGAKITVDCANLMNKGLEVMEARWLFDLPLDRVDVVLHPQSIVHSLVTFADGSTKAQLGLPDMRLPIQYALSHPQRWPSALPRLDLAAVGGLTFAQLDITRYPAFALALQAGRARGTHPAVLCAADEVAVEAFLQGHIRFTGIPGVIAAVLERHGGCSSPKLADILEADSWARREARRVVSLESLV